MSTPIRHLFLTPAAFFAMLWPAGRECQAHVVPVIHATLRIADTEITLSERTDIRILLDGETAARFLAQKRPSPGETPDSATPFERACTKALEEAVSIAIDGTGTPAPRLCRIEAEPGPDGETDHLAMSEAVIPLPPGAGAVEITLDAKAPASLILIASEDDGKPIGRGQVLFPGERGRPIPVPAPTAAVPAARPPAGEIPWRTPATPGTGAGEATATPVGPEQTGTATLWGFLRLGFRHILPDGLDHILFIAGLFLFGHRLRPLLAQVTTFTVAHSITLALSALGIYRMDGSIAEPLIAASIVVIGLENCLARHERRSAGWLRLGIVFGFGLIHGLGIANMLAGYDLGGGFLLPLVGFNLGVEIGQITVVGFCFLALGAWLNHPRYRRRIAAPLSLTIAAIGAWWFLERSFLGG